MCSSERHESHSRRWLDLECSGQKRQYPESAVIVSIYILDLHGLLHGCVFIQLSRLPRYIVYDFLEITMNVW